MKNRLLIACAGSGKTTYLVEQALMRKNKKILITTYTEENESVIRNMFIKKVGFQPENVFIQTWFSFLLQHGVRPFQSILNSSVHDKDIGFHLTNEKSGQRNKGSLGKPIYWGENDFLNFYFTKSMKIYSDKISKYVIRCNEQSGNSVINRISKIFDCVFIDEVQDLAGYDLDVIQLFFKSSSEIILVGDPRQTTYLTHRTAKYEKYSDGRIKEFVTNELGKKATCEVDETTLGESHRCDERISAFSGELYPELPTPKSCKCLACRVDDKGHSGVFFVRQQDVDNYLSIYKPVQLRWNSKVQHNSQYPVKNFGQSKGLTFERALIYPTKDMLRWLKNHSVDLKSEARARFYVGVTRARHSVAIVVENQPDEKLCAVGLVWGCE